MYVKIWQAKQPKAFEWNVKLLIVLSWAQDELFLSVTEDLDS